MTYPESLQYLNSFINYEKIPVWPYKESLQLERFRNFLTLLGNPQDELKCIHVAGTKGKGSTCAFIAYILREAGFDVGFYTSPHLMDFRERIRILRPHAGTGRPALMRPTLLEGSASASWRRNCAGVRFVAHEFEGRISGKDLAGLTKRLKPAIERYNTISRYGPLTFFEVCTALAFLYFKEKGTDFVVLETGLGGRLDATSAVDPYVCVITPISYEHTDKLGNTLGSIAREKAGIIKGSAAVSAPQQKEALKAIRQKCRREKTRLCLVGKDILYKKEKDYSRIKGRLGDYAHLRINLIGEHQLMNAAVAVAAIEELESQGIRINPGAIKQGLAHTLWPGRCEVIARRPLIVLDGAQNVASAEALKKTIRDNFKYKKLILVLGISNDKDIRGICRALYPLADKVIVTRADTPRATQTEVLERYCKGKELYASSTVKEARHMALATACPGDLILVCGSLFVVGEFKHAALQH